ncbi:helix-turn-helix domain-containing protein [Streptomyces sp. NPDC004096]
MRKSRRLPTRARVSCRPRRPTRRWPCSIGLCRFPASTTGPVSVREWPSPTVSDCAQRECPARPEGTVDGAADLRGPRRVAVGRPCRTRAQRDRECRPARIGLPWLTPQESEVAHLAVSGGTNQQIAEKLHPSHRTVSGHLHQVFPNPGITSRAAPWPT